jgi:hypothetical protein
MGDHKFVSVRVLLEVAQIIPDGLGAALSRVGEHVIDLLALRPVK